MRLEIISKPTIKKTKQISIPHTSPYFHLRHLYFPHINKRDRRRKGFIFLENSKNFLSADPFPLRLVYCLTSKTLFQQEIFTDSA
ncbi:hypothetical protein [Peribacillus saganii]|uniref:hypothetical protein n=1 Tax=Peribacillus saganii TaxID=2303992 RepID=UPI00115E8F49|nr:hypothetical protein [Peribacillus saganii]